MVKYGQQCRLLTPLSAYCLSVLIVHGWQDIGLWQCLTEPPNTGAGASHDAIQLAETNILSDADIISPELKADNK
jgi:hypothetical protein